MCENMKGVFKGGCMSGMENERMRGFYVSARPKRWQNPNGGSTIGPFALKVYFQMHRGALEALKHLCRARKTGMVDQEEHRFKGQARRGRQQQEQRTITSRTQSPDSTTPTTTFTNLGFGGPSRLRVSVYHRIHPPDLFMLAFLKHFDVDVLTDPRPWVCLG